MCKLATRVRRTRTCARHAARTRERTNASCLRFSTPRSTTTTSTSTGERSSPPRRKPHGPCVSGISSLRFESCFTARAKDGCFPTPRAGVPVASISRFTRDERDGDIRLGACEAFGARNRRSDRSRRADTAVPARAPGSLSCNPHGPLLPHRKVQPTDRETPRFFRLPARDRHVVLPPDIAKLLPKGRLLSEVRFRSPNEGRGFPRPSFSGGGATPRFNDCHSPCAQQRATFGCERWFFKAFPPKPSRHPRAP